jgi:hypothetical protein
MKKSRFTTFSNVSPYILHNTLVNSLITIDDDSELIDKVQHLMKNDLSLIDEDSGNHPLK